MPIPPFDFIINALPPFLSDPTDFNDVSPYRCTVSELCDFYGTSAERRTILDGLLKVRQGLIDAGVEGFQWIGGSFTENIESQERRTPNDIDVVTFVASPVSDAEIDNALRNAGPMFQEPSRLETEWAVHHFTLPLSTDPELLVDLVKYWYGLFSHRRDRTWKGMLHLDLNRSCDDSKGRRILPETDHERP